MVGNLNTGKSTLFNSLTGLNQKVGNFPGVTVDKKSGSFKINEISVDLVDIQKLLNTGAFLSTTYDIEVDGGKKQMVLPRDVQFNSDTR